MRNAWRWMVLLVGVLSLVGCDHATKFAAKAQLEAGPPAELLPPLLQLRYVENRDIAFNLLSFIPEGVRAPLLLFLGAGAIASVLWTLTRGRVSGVPRVGLVLVLGGAIGNYLDRVVRGYVVDFIHVAHWPVFNVADILVTVGAALLLFQAFRQRTTFRGGGSSVEI